MHGEQNASVASLIHPPGYSIKLWDKPLPSQLKDSRSRVFVLRVDGGLEYAKQMTATEIGVLWGVAKARLETELTEVEGPETGPETASPCAER